MLRTLKLLPIAAASLLTALALAPLSAPMASAADSLTNLGPVGPDAPILATIGDHLLIAYFEPDNGKCAVSVVVSDTSKAARAPTRVRVALYPGELFHVDSVMDESVVLTCGPNAAMLTVLNRGELLTKAAHVN